MREKISQAFISLVSENRTSKVSVESICKRAGISKPTFYKYFRDKYRVTEYIFLHEIVEPMERLTTENLEMGRKDAKEVTSDFYRGFYRRKDFYCCLILEEKQNSLFDTIIDRLIDINKKYLAHLQGLDAIDTEYIAYRYAVLQAMLLRKWMRDGMEVPPEKMSDYYYFAYENK